ncbi:MAG: ArnT family glycosyltransferase [Thermodesulfobacteriota bacterium]
MDYFYLLISLIVPVLAGTFFVRWLLRSEAGAGSFEAVFFGFGVGLGFTALEMFYLGLLGLPFSRVTVALPLLLVILIFSLLSRTRGKVSAVAPVKGLAPSRWRLYLIIIMVSWIALKTGFVLYESLTRPSYAYDTYINWAVAGKIFFYRAGLILDPTDEHFFGSGYRAFIGHPLHLPLLQTWIALVLGKFHEVYIKAPGLLYFIGILGVLYYGVKREAGAFYALVTVFFMVSVPIFTVHGQDACSDLPLSLFALSGTVALWRFFREDSLSYLVLSGILLGMAVFVKNEGLFFPFAAGLVLLVFLLLRKRAVAAPMAVFIITIALIAGPWLLFKFHYGLGFGHTGTSSEFKWFSDPLYSGQEGYGIHWEVISIGLRSMFFNANYNLVFPLWIFATLLAWKKVLRTELKYLYMIILLVFSMFFFIYLTLEVTAVTDQSGIHRNTLTYLPIVYFTTALVLSAFWPDQGRETPESEPPAHMPPPLTGKPSDDIL